MGQKKGNKVIGMSNINEFKIGQYVKIHEDNTMMDVTKPLKILEMQTKNCIYTEYTLLKVQDKNGNTEWINTIYCKPMPEYKPEETITDIARKIFANHKSHNQHAVDGTKGGKNGKQTNISQ